MNSVPSITLRPAAAEDTERLLQWRNDPLTREMAGSQDRIEWEEHVAWLRSVLDDENRRLWVAEDDGEPVGRFRVDYEDDRARLSWTVAPDHRRKGYGSAIVAEGVRRVQELDREARIIAKIKPKNAPSKKVAEYAGLEHQGMEEGWELWSVES